MATPEELLHFVEILNAESDRGCILVGATMLDEVLKKLLARLFDGLGEKELFLSDRPFGSFSGKICAVYGLGVVTNEDHRDLELVRKIRNDAAHVIGKPGDRDRTTFADPIVASRCRELSFAQCAGRQIPARISFVFTVCWLVATFEGRMGAWDRGAAEGVPKGVNLSTLLAMASEPRFRPSAEELAKLLPE